MEQIIEKLVKGEIRFHEVDEYTESCEQAIEIRRKAIEKLTGVELGNIGYFSIDAKKAMDKNIENMIGAVQIPMGVAGPLHIEGDFAKGDFFVPLSTTEGALVASINRGCKAVTEAGGAKTVILEDKMTRAPVLRTGNIKESKQVVEWVNKNFKKLKDAAESTTRYGKLLRIEPFVVGRNVFLRFVYSTGDAMGMNMVTIATDKAIEILEDELGFVQHIALSGNLCTDKKPTAINFLLGRGKTVLAEATVPKKVVKEELKTTAEAIIEVNYRKNLVGSAQAVSYGFNAHFANIIGAIFLATGQDEAHIVEGSHGITTAERAGNGDLYFSIKLPALNIGTVGGGTGLSTQKEALKIMGVYGGGDPPGANAKKFAEVTAATVLAGELSLLGALAARHLSKAHKLLGR